MCMIRALVYTVWLEGLCLSDGYSVSCILYGQSICVYCMAKGFCVYWRVRVGRRGVILSGNVQLQALGYMYR